MGLVSQKYAVLQQWMLGDLAKTSCLVFALQKPEFEYTQRFQEQSLTSS